MTEIRSWAIMLCVSMIITSVVLFIAPEGSLKKFLSYIISVYIITVVLLPLTKMDFSHLTDFTQDENIQSLEEYSVMLDEYIYDSGKNVIEDAVRNELDKICSDKYSVETYFVKNNDKYLTVDRIEVSIPESDIKKISEIRKIIGEMTGVIPKVNIYEFQSDN